LGPPWGLARLSLPPSKEGTRYVNVFTGEALSPEEDGGLVLSAIFSSFPVALFYSQQ
jgi:hypothetical protein